MKKFDKLTSSAVPLPVENIDTDQIIPARFLKSITRDGFGKNLFRDWRYTNEETENSTFVLNNKKYSGEIFVCGKNFGCGSSREHAAWAILDYGFRVVISSFFADIFKGNALNNGLIPIQVTDAQLKSIFEAIEQDSNVKITVDLKDQKLILNHPEKGFESKFEINEYNKICILNGFDDVDFLLNNKEDIEKFEKNRKYFFNEL